MPHLYDNALRGPVLRSNADHRGILRTFLCTIVVCLLFPVQALGWSAMEWAGEMTSGDWINPATDTGAGPWQFVPIDGNQYFWTIVHVPQDGDKGTNSFLYKFYMENDWVTGGNVFSLNGRSDTFYQTTSNDSWLNYTGNGNNTAQFADSGYYYVEGYNYWTGSQNLLQANIGAGRVKMDGRQYNQSSNEDFKEWPRVSLMGRDSRNAEDEDTLFVYWDTTFLYIGFEGFTAGLQDFFVAIDVDGENSGVDIGDNWSGGYHFLPFKADYMLEVEGSTYKSVRNAIDTGDRWNDPGDGKIKGGNSIGEYVGTFSEFRIRWSHIGGSPTTLGICAWQKWEDARNIMHSWPTQNASSNTDIGDTLLYYYAWSSPTGVHNIVNPVADSAIRRGGPKINEVLWNSAVDTEQYVEIYNPRSFPLDISNYHLMDLATNDSFAFPPGTVIRARENVIVHPRTGTNYTDTFGIRHFYSRTTWDIGGAGSGNDSGALELHKAVPPSHDTMMDFVAWTNDGSIDNASWDDTAVRASIWTSGSAIDNYSGAANTDSPLYRKNDGVDTDGTTTAEWGQLSQTFLPGVTNNGGFPTTITSVAFKEADFSTDRAYYIAGETVYILVTATGASATCTEATVVEIDNAGNLDVVCYEQGVNSTSFRGIIRTTAGSSKLYHSAEDTMTLPGNSVITARSKLSPGVCDTAAIDSYPYLSRAAYDHRSRNLTLYFTQPIDTSTVDVAGCTLQTTSAGGSAQSFSGATVKNGVDSNGFSITLTAAQRNSIALWEDSTLFVNFTAGMASGTSTLSVGAVSASSARALDSYVTGVDTGVKINEVYPQAGTYNDSAYIEFYFLSDAEYGWIDLRNWYVAERTDTLDFPINASINLGAGDYFVIYRDSGVSDLTMTAGAADTGSYYAGTKFFSATDYNQVALYNNRNVQDSTTIVDYLSWHRSNVTGGSLPETQHAVDAGMWTAQDSFVFTAGYDADGGQKSIQLFNNGADSNSSSSWKDTDNYTPNRTNRTNDPPTVTVTDIIMKSGKGAFLPGESYALRIKYSDVNGADSTVRFDFRIGNGGDDTVWYYSAAGHTPVALDGSDKVSNVSIDSSYTGNDVTCTWYFQFGWNFTDAGTYVIAARATDNYPETGTWTESTVLWTYDKDLVLSGTLAGSGASNGAMGGGMWAQAGQSVTWSGLTVYFQNTTISPQTYFCTFAITDDDSRSTTQTGAVTLSTATTIDTQVDLTESVVITLMGVPSPGTFDTSTRVYFSSFKTDDSAPIIRVNGDTTYVFKADTYSRAPSINIDFLELDSTTLLDTIQYNVDGAWYTISSGDIDTWTRDWFLSEIAYSNLDTAANPCTVSLRVYDMAGWSATTTILIYYEPIVIDGFVSDWQGDEYIQVCSSENLWFMLAWDDTALYFAYQPKDIATDNAGDFFVYMDMGNIQTGNNTSINWGGGGSYTLPSDTGAKWDAAFCIDNSALVEFQRDTGSGWLVTETPLVSVTAYIGWSGRTTTEVRIPWAKLTSNQGKPDTFNILAWQQYETSNNAWTAYPASNPNGGSTTDPTFYYPYLSTADTVSPNSVIHELINVDAGLGEWKDTTKLPAWRSGVTVSQYRVTWDNTFLYFAFSRGDAFPNLPTEYDVIQVYIDTCQVANSGTYTTDNWAGTHQLPFAADWSFFYSVNHAGLGGTYTNLRKWNGAAWVGDQSWAGAAARSTSAGIAEFSIPWRDIGATETSPITQMKFVIFTMNGSSAFLWTIAPNGNIGGAASDTITTFIQYDSMSLAQLQPTAPWHYRCSQALSAGDTKVPPFTPYIDGSKDPGWGDTPDAQSPSAALPDNTSTANDGHRFPGGRADSIYITNDIAYLYLGWIAHGDHYDDVDKQTSHYGFIFFTDSYPEGTSYDPYKTTEKTTRVYQQAADFWMMGYAAYAMNDYSGLMIYKNNDYGAWDTGTSLVNGTDYKVNISNAWGEARVPLATLGVRPGDTIGVIFMSRHESNKAGISDMTPYQAGVVSNWSDNNATIAAQNAKVYVVQTASNANITHRPSTEPVTGKGLMRLPLSPSSSEAAVLTIGASPAGSYTRIYVFYSTSAIFTSYDTVTMVSAFTSGTDEYFQGNIPASFAKGDTVYYYVKVDETVDNFVYGTDTYSYVTASENTARTNAFQLLVQNAVPTTPSVASVTPQTPTDASTLTVTASGSTDQDGDTILYLFQWYQNGGAVGDATRVDSTSPYTATVGGDSTTVGDKWYCMVSAGDGRDTSGAKQSTVVELNALNTWSGTAPIEVNCARIADSEWIWTDKSSDQRQLVASSGNFDITQCRFEMDSMYLYFLFYFTDLSNANYPNISITFDTDATQGSGATSIGDEGQTNIDSGYRTPAAAWESQMVLHAVEADSPIIEVVRGSEWSETGTALFIDTQTSLIKGKVMRSMLGVQGSGAARCSLAVFKNRLGRASSINSTVEFTGCDALEVLSIPGFYGVASNTNDKTLSFTASDEELSDSDVDFWFQLRYDAEGLVSNGTPAKVTNPGPADAGTTASLKPTFSWSMTSDTDSSDTVTSYLIEIGTSVGLVGSVEYRVNVPGETTSWVPPSNLLSDSYYWRVRARDRTGTLSDSTTWSFGVTTPTIGVSRPLDMNNVNNMGQYQDDESAFDTLYFQWAPATHSSDWNIQNYAIEISESLNFDTVIVADTLIGTTAGCTTYYQIPASYSLTRGKMYYARTRAGDTAGTQNWSNYSQASDGILYSRKTVDGDSTDWMPVLSVSANNESYVASPYYEAAWRDLSGDQRVDVAAAKDYWDLMDFRISTDSFNMYVYARFDTWSDGVPTIQIALDVNNNSVSRVFMGRNVYAEDDYVNATVAREYVVICRTGNDDVRIYDAYFNITGYGKYTEKSADKSVELCIPLKYVGGVDQYTSDTVNVTAAVWYNDNGNTGQNGANNSNVVDAITFVTTTWSEVSDNVIDYWLAVGCDSQSQVSGIKVETAAYTAPPTNPNPGSSYYGSFRDYIIYNVFVDRFWSGTSTNTAYDPLMTGGDFQGLIDKAQYFCDLGINAFQLSPIFDYGGGAWGYGQSDLYRVQNSYVVQNWNSYKGWNDYVELVKAFKRRNITMGLDWIPGQIYGDANSGGTIAKNPKMWLGERFGGRRILQYVSDVRQFFVDHTRFLYSLGTKLFRVDNPKFYPDPYEQGLPFFAYWNEQVKAFAPDLYSYGEVPDATAVIGAFCSDGERMTGMLDFNTGFAIKTWANDGASTSGSSFRGTFDGNMSSYSSGSNTSVMVNYYENHDHDRAYHGLSDDMSWNGSIGDMQTLMMWEASGPGNPCIFYGDERVMMGKKDWTYPGWQSTDNTSAFGNTRAFPWDWSGAAGDIMSAVSKAFKGRQAFPGLRYDQGSIYWLENGAGKPISFRRGSGTSEEVIVLINPNDGSYTFNNISTGYGSATYKDWFTGGEATASGYNIGSFNVAANYAAFLKVNSFGLASANIRVRNNSGVLKGAIVDVNSKSAYTEETDDAGMAYISDIVTAKSGTTAGTVNIWYPGYNKYSVSWNFTDGWTYNVDINIDTDPSAGADATAPSAPAGLSGLARDQAVVLDWGDNSEGDIESYYIYRSTTPNDASAAMIMEVIRSTYYDKQLDDKLTNGQTYYYKVKARDRNGNTSGFSNEISVTPNLTYVTFQVDMSGSGLSNISKVYMKGNAYNMSRSDFNNTYKMPEIDPLVAMDYKGRNIWEKTVPLDPTMHVNYSFTCNYNGGATWYDEWGFWNSYSYENARGVTVPPYAGDTYPVVHLWMTGGDASPQAPQGLTAVGQNQTIKLGWSLNIEVDADRYELWRSTDATNYGVIANIDKGVINYTDNSLTNGTTYYYKMKAADKANNFSGFSSVVQTKPTASADTVAPSRPTSLAAYNGGMNTVLLKWTYNTEGDLAGYNIYRGTTPGFVASVANRLNEAVITPSMTPEWQDSTAQTGTQYYYAVAAVDDFTNESDSSNVLSVKLARLTFSLDIGSLPHSGDMKITANDNYVTWTGKTMTDSGAYTWTYATDFIVGSSLQYKYMGDTLEQSFTTASGNREITVPDASSQSYVDDWQEYPDVVTGLTGQPDSASVYLFWTANTADKDLTGYNVYKQESGGSFTKMNTSLITVANYKVTGLTNGTTYSFAVRAVDGGDLTLESPNSNIVNIKPSGYVYVDFRN